jgi:hypothetical protein
MFAKHIAAKVLVSRFYVKSSYNSKM